MTQPPRPQDVTKKNPAPESELLAEERAHPTIFPNRPLRVLAMFEGFYHGSPSEIEPTHISTQQFPDLELIGIVATLQEPEGLFAQCGWFANDDLDWFWARITGVKSVELRRDSRFRGGVPSVWLRTAFADYVMTTPHWSYDDMWASALSLLGGQRCDIWPIGGVPPSWWPLRLADRWPYEQPTGVKRTVSTDTEQLELLTQELSVESSTARTPWVRLGPYGAGHQPGGLVTNLHHLTEWDPQPDCGLRVTRDPAAKSGIGVSEQAGTGDEARRAKRARPPHM